MRCRSWSLGAFCSLLSLPNLARAVLVETSGNLEQAYQSRRNVRFKTNWQLTQTFSNTANAASSQPHGEPRPREMSGNVSVDVILIMERVFDAAIWRSLLIFALPRQPQKRLPSVSTYVRARARRPHTPHYFKHYRRARSNRALCARRSGFAHTPLRAQPHFGAAPARAGVKGAPGPTRSRRAKGCSQQHKNI